MAKKRKKRMSRKELKEPDKLLSTMERAVGYLAARRRAVAIVIGAVVVLTGLGVFYRIRSRSQAEKASALLRKGMETYSASVDPAVKPGEKGEDGSFHDVASRAKAALRIFGQVVSKYEGYGPARVAHLYRGLCLYDLKQFDKAAAAFRKVLNTKPGGGCGCGGGDEVGSDGLQAVALENLGYALAARGKLSQAEKIFGKLRVLDHGARRDWALYHEALLRERKHDLRGAVAAYEQIARGPSTSKKGPSMLDRSPLGDFARKRARYLKAKLATGGAAARPAARRAAPRGTQRPAMGAGSARAAAMGAGAARAAAMGAGAARAAAMGAGSARAAAMGAGAARAAAMGAGSARAAAMGAGAARAAAMPPAGMPPAPMTR